jgi:hypothetical protein
VRPVASRSAVSISYASVLLLCDHHACLLWDIQVHLNVMDGGVQEKMFYNVSHN